MTQDPFNQPFDATPQQPQQPMYLPEGQPVDAAGIAAANAAAAATAKPPMSVKTKRVIAGVAGLAVIGGGIGAAVAGKAFASDSANSGSEHGRGMGGMGGGMGGQTGMRGGMGSVYSESTVAATDGTTTTTISQLGTVTAVDSSSLNVKSGDGTEITYSIGSVSVTSDIISGATVRVSGTGSVQAAQLTQVKISTEKSDGSSSSSSSSQSGGTNGGRGGNMGTPPDGAAAGGGAPSGNAPSANGATGGTSASAIEPLHSKQVSYRDGKYVTTISVHGTVVTVSSDSLKVRSSDGFEQTFGITSATRQGTTATENAEVEVMGTVSGDSVTAEFVGAPRSANQGSVTQDGSQLPKSVQPAASAPTT